MINHIKNFQLQKLGFIFFICPPPPRIYFSLTEVIIKFNKVPLKKIYFSRPLNAWCWWNDWTIMLNNQQFISVILMIMIFAMLEQSACLFVFCLPVSFCSFIKQKQNNCWSIFFCLCFLQLSWIRKSCHVWWRRGRRTQRSSSMSGRPSRSYATRNKSQTWTGSQSKSTADNTDVVMLFMNINGCVSSPVSVLGH